jgi:hypothetical protein
LSDPYPTFDQLRAAAPIFWSEKSKYWLVTSYEIGNEIVRDLRFEKRLERWNQINPIMKMLPGPAHLIKSRANWMINQNPPEHTHLRGLVNKAFSPKMVQQMHGSIQTVAERLIDNAVAKGGMEFISEFAFLVPITVICEMLGIPSADHEKFRQWSNAMTQTLEPGSITNPSVLHVSNHAGDELHDYLEPLVQERRKNPKADLITALVEAEIEGQKLEESEVIGNIMLLLVAGHETTVNLIGNGMFALCKHPDQLKLLKEHPEYIDGAVEEFLRYDSPVQTVRRLAHEDMEFHGQKLHKGDMVIVFLGACNRDPQFFAEPNTLDITRKENKHLSFSQGIHHCLGASLARLEGSIAISTVLKKVPDIRLAEGQKLEHKHPFNLRGLKEMHVLF